MQAAAESGSEAAAADLVGPPLPEGAEYLWEMFKELHAVRTASGFSVNPITFTELQAYQQTYGVQLEPGEIKVMRTLDMIYMQQVQLRNAKPEQRARMEARIREDESEDDEVIDEE